MRVLANRLAQVALYGLLGVSGVHAVDEPGNATDDVDMRVVQALNPLPHCLSSWSASLDWLRQGLVRAPERPMSPAGMVGDGRWIRVDKKGNPKGTADDAADVACIQDSMTQLVWAVGLEGKNPVRRFPGGPADISTQSLIERARSERWCGKSDWKLPSKTQALSLVNYSRVRVDGETSAWRQSGFPLVGSVWTGSYAVAGSQQGHWWTVSLVDGYAYLESPIYNPSNDAQRHTTLLVTSGSCMVLNRAFAK